MHLSKLYNKFDSRCRSYSNRKDEIIALRGTINEWKFNHLTEVLISDIWQSWCHFSRELFFNSCRGSTARNGEIIAPLSGDHSWERLAYIGKQASQNRNPTPNGHISFAIRKEPTWGDLDVFTKILSKVKPDNHQTLLTSYGSFSSLKHLQIVRNSCAHKNVETMAVISGLSSSYSFGKLGNSTDIAWKNSLDSGIYALELWLHEMNLIADLATSTR